MNRVELMHGDCLEEMKKLPENSVDAIVTDPPYGLEFMGKDWDKGVPDVKFWVEMMRVLKPGGHLLSFSGTRTYHRMATAIEDAGFEVRDMIEWVYGSGFPKSLNIGKAVDKLQGNERVVVGTETTPYKVDGKAKEGVSLVGSVRGDFCKQMNEEGYRINTITKGTSEYEGWGTALKPAHEPICMARKPLAEKTVAENCLKWGTGGINIDESRVESNEELGRNNNARTSGTSFVVQKETMRIDNSNGKRFPANLIHDNSEEVRECFPETVPTSYATNKTNKGGMFNYPGHGTEKINDEGRNASRFFKSIIYQAKAPKNQRYSLLTCNCQTVKLEAWQKQDQNQKEKTGGISQEVDTSEKVLTEDSNSSTSISGKKQMGQSQKDMDSTTSTTTSKTTDLKTSNSLLQQNTNESTEGAKSETENGGSLAEYAKNSNQSPQNTGISQEKDGHCMGVAVSATLAESYRKSVCLNCGGEVKSSGHPTQKPIALMEYLITMVTPKGGTVLDPFMGSGTTGIAAKNLNRNFIGMELDKDYYEIAKKRTYE